MPYRKLRGENRNDSSGRRNTMTKLGMIIDVLHGEARLNGKNSKV